MSGSCVILINLALHHDYLVFHSPPYPFRPRPDGISGPGGQQVTQIMQAQHVPPHPHFLTCHSHLGHHQSDVHTVRISSSPTPSTAEDWKVDPAIGRDPPGDIAGPRLWKAGRVWREDKHGYRRFSERPQAVGPPNDQETYRFTGRRLPGHLPLTIPLCEGGTTLVSGTMVLEEGGQKEDTWYSQQTSDLAMSCHGTVVLRPLISAAAMTVLGDNPSFLPNTAPATISDPVDYRVSLPWLSSSTSAISQRAQSRAHEWASCRDSRPSLHPKPCA